MKNSHVSPKVKAVIFDFDGTLANSFPVLVHALEYVLKRAPFTPEEIEELHHYSAREIIKVLKIRQWRLPLLIAKGIKEVDRNRDDISIFPGIADVLKALRQRGYKLYIVSSHSSNGIASFIEHNELDGTFSHIFGKVGLFGKPKVLQKLRRQFGYTADECIFVGDEVRDIEAAHKAGIRCIACTWGFNSTQSLKKGRPSAIIDTPTELTQALDTLS